MKIWIDDIRPAPDGYVWIKSVEEAKYCISINEYLRLSIKDAIDKGYVEPFKQEKIEIIDIDHDAGEYYKDGGDYINILNWIEEMGYNFPIHIHSMNPVGVSNMRAIIEKNGWKEIK